MNYAYKEAFTEVEYILQNMEEDEVKKIPQSVIEVLRENKLKHYKVNIDLSIPLEEQKLKSETKAVLSILYRKFLCDEEEREILEKEFLNKLKREKEIEEQNRSKQHISKDSNVEIDYGFKKMERIKSEKNLDMITVDKEYKWYQKLFDKIKAMIGK